MCTTPPITPGPLVDHVEASKANARALGYGGIDFTQRLDGTWVATAPKGERYGAALPMGIGPTREEAAASLLRMLRPRP